MLMNVILKKYCTVKYTMKCQYLEDVLIQWAKFPEDQRIML